MCHTSSFLKPFFTTLQQSSCKIVIHVFDTTANCATYAYSLRIYNLRLILKTFCIGLLVSFMLTEKQIFSQTPN